ncbi:MAG: hypothetical protein COA59_00240 [Colwellia sp.]|nr:MAG: hypothetical protein COA59_00240 [Colwellia sp.]
MKISSYFTGEKLTQGQQELLVELECFLLATNVSIFILKGYAGTGKSYLMAGVTRYLKAQNKQVVIVAPTGKAAKVIASKVGYEAKTIHRVIYSSYENDKEPSDEYIQQNQDEIYSRIRKNEDAVDCIYIADEASMISDKYSQSDVGKFGSGYLLQDLLRYLDIENTPNRKVIFIGDNAQLPPVRNIYSPALDEILLNEAYQYNCQSFELTEVVRQKAESGVMKNATALRDAIEFSDFVEFEFDTSSDEVYALLNKAFLDKYFEICNDKVEGTENSIVIARTNKQVNDYTCDIRAKLFSPAAPIQVNEKVICVRNYQTKSNFISNGEFGRVTNILSDIECRAVEVKEKTYEGVRVTTVELRFIDVEIEFTDDHGQPYLLTRKVLLNLLYKSTPRFEGIEKQALHVDFYNRYLALYKPDGIGYKDAKRNDPYLNFLHIKFGYAITCHKAQGSEWRNVFVDAYHNQRMTKDYRWLYTAITRTADKLYIKL